MPIFYTDSGSFNRLEVTGSTIFSGSVAITGSITHNSGGITGSLFGTSSFATVAATASYFSGSVSFPDGATFTFVTASAIIVSGGIAGSLTGSFTGSWKQLFVGTTAPASPAINDLWVDTN